jgi:hypothetical protein
MMLRVLTTHVFEYFDASSDVLLSTTQVYYAIV